MPREVHPTEVCLGVYGIRHAAHRPYGECRLWAFASELYFDLYREVVLPRSPRTLSRMRRRTARPSSNACAHFSLSKCPLRAGICFAARLICSSCFILAYMLRSHSLSLSLFSYPLLSFTSSVVLPSPSLSHPLHLNLSLSLSLSPSLPSRRRIATDLSATLRVCIHVYAPSGDTPSSNSVSLSLFFSLPSHGRVHPLSLTLLFLSLYVALPSYLSFAFLYPVRLSVFASDYAPPARW